VRRYLVEQLRFSNFIVKEIPLGEEWLAAADEAFVTNAVIGLRRIKNFREKTYGKRITQKIYNDYISPLLK
jgi:branched-chain amino acid aminotransferase